MICTHTISSNEASIVAVAALDDLVNDLVKASRLKMSPAFLDWVADEATPLVERCVARAFYSPRFANSLRMGDPRIALARWVRHWVGPWIVANFDDLSVYLPEFANSRSSGLPTAGPALPARAQAPVWRRPRAWPHLPAVAASPV
ncbi:MAG: hypothetical protein Q8O29_10700 [Polaromonas sp.]|uniref:hypothetical protein n=1 Tax=Polaromonas sp. TaxID=1869339 RepID=UPI0027373C2D|nr:hypothetical protein [Polaromonas sp.]MDP2818720.1 hypothetical protein [Polaromonas sp.]